jgi:uncharacterized membrane protein YccC
MKTGQSAPTKLAKFGVALLSARLVNPVTPDHLKQAVKTGLAAGLCLYATRLFKLPQGYWGAISAIIVMQSNFATTLRASWARLAGTAIGATTGALFVAFWGGHLLAFGFAVAVAILVCESLGLPESYRLAGATVAIVMLVNRVGSPWVIAFDRFLEVGLGVVIALLVMVLVWPARASRRLRGGIAEALLSLDSLCRAVVRRYREAGGEHVVEMRSKLDEVMRQNEDLLKQAGYEYNARPQEHETLVLLLEHLSRVEQEISGLELAVKNGEKDAYHEALEPELGDFATKISAAFRRLAEDIRAWSLRPDWPQVGAALSALDDKASRVRASGAPIRYGLDEILRFYSFLLGLRSVAKELELMRSEECRALSSG